MYSEGFPDQVPEGWVPPAEDWDPQGSQVRAGAKHPPELWRIAGEAQLGQTLAIPAGTAMKGFTLAYLEG